MQPPDGALGTFWSGSPPALCLTGLCQPGPCPALPRPPQGAAGPGPGTRAWLLRPGLPWLCPGAPHPCTRGGRSPHHAQVWGEQGKGSGRPSLCGKVPHYAQVWGAQGKGSGRPSLCGRVPHYAQV